MLAGKRLFFIVELLLLSLCVAAQEKVQENNIDSISVKLSDFDHSIFFNYRFEPNHILVFGEQVIDSISRPLKTEPTKMYHEHKELRWEVLSADTVSRFVDFAISLVQDSASNWIEDCNGNGYETDKTHLEIYAFLGGNKLFRRVVFEPNCRYVSYINDYAAFLRRLGWF